MRIAIITSGCRPGLDGTTIAVHERCRRLSAWGHDVLVVGPDYAPLERYFPDWSQYLGEIFPRVRVVSVPCSTFFGVEGEPNPTPRAFAVLEKNLAEFRPDIIHVDEPERLTYGYWRRPGLGYARRHGIPIVAFYHTNYVDYGPDFISLPGPAMSLLQRIVVPAITGIYNAYDATLVPSETTARKLAQYGIRNLVPGNFNGVDFGRFDSAERMPRFFEQRFGISDLGDRVKLLFVGRLTPDKGWSFAMKALPALADRIGRDKIAIIVAGSGDMQDEVERCLSGHIDAVHLLGRVQPEQMPAVFANADIHVSCSQKETFGLTTLEANSAGIPVVAPAAGGFMDTIRVGENGATYVLDDVEDFIRVIVPFIDDPSWRRACGQVARTYAQAFDWDRTIASWLETITSVAAGAAGGTLARRGIPR